MAGIECPISGLACVVSISGMPAPHPGLVMCGPRSFENFKLRQIVVVRDTE